MTQRKSLVFRSPETIRSDFSANPFLEKCLKFKWIDIFGFSLFAHFSVGWKIFGKSKASKSPRGSKSVANLGTENTLLQSKVQGLQGAKLRPQGPMKSNDFNGQICIPM